ncbi:MAG TPA: extracellular solute-binding protein, partial [Bacillota bacterium]|nr:extracellular solute-binding protein [Bacillota bacterium]
MQGGVWWKRRPKSRNFRSSLLILGLLLWGFQNLEGVFAAPAPVTLKLWTHERHMAELTRELADEFNATVGREKGIRVAVRVLGDGASAIFQASQRKREGPDLYSTNFNTGYADRFQSGAQIWLDGLPGFKEWKAAWPSWYWQEGVTTYHGRVFAIPVQVLNSRLIYNRDLFRQVGWDPDQPPRTYEEVRAIAHAITLKCKGSAYGFAYCGADAWQTEWMPSQWAEA